MQDRLKKKKHLLDIINNLPKKPGAYLFYNKDEEVIYIGKAKSLKLRVSSYFKNDTSKVNLKTRVLIDKIEKISFVVVNTEMDALLLENNLIKKHQPKYNILLKDGKTYPWICVSNEKLPRIFQARTVKKNTGEYYGPYASSKVVRALLSFFSDIFYANGWTPFSFLKRKVDSEEELNNYLQIITHIKKILSGRIQLVINELKEKMHVYSHNLEFEKAEMIKQQLELLKTYQAKSIVVNPKINDVDVFSIISDQKSAFINYMKVIGGCIVQTQSVELNKKLNETDEELLRLVIIDTRNKYKSTSKNIYSSIVFKNKISDLNISKPKIGDKRKLVELSLKNARIMQSNKQNASAVKKEKASKKNILVALQKDLRLKESPQHIECFDISNIQGAHSVGSCVVFKNGIASKKDYRFFNIKTVKTPNDFQSIEEVIYRRYKAALTEKKLLPNLIIIDGGKGQLNSALKSLEKLNLTGSIPIISIAKRLEEIFFPNDKIPLYLDKRSASLKLIQKIRNESHRFAIKKHRKKRIKNTLKTSLEDIPGIGPKTVQVLISHFGSTKKVFSAKREDIIKLVGEAKTRLIFK
jgi:excinuclease ABC subunit C